MRRAAVRVKRDGYFGDPLLAQARLDDHPRGEFHAGASLIKALEEIFAKPPHPAIHVMNGGVEPSSHEH